MPAVLVPTHCPFTLLRWFVKALPNDWLLCLALPSKNAFRKSRANFAWLPGNVTMFTPPGRPSGGPPVDGGTAGLNTTPV